MTNNQRDVYMTLLLAGREDEATAYRDRCEAEASPRLAGGLPHYTKEEWAQMEREHPDYTGKWEPSPFNLDRVAAGEVPAEYIGRRNMLKYEPGVGTVLLTEGAHFTIGD